MFVLYLNMLENDGDRERFAVLYRQYEKKMYSIAFGILQDPYLAEDTVHDAFIKIIKNFDSCKKIPCDKMTSWIVIIVKHTALDLLRKRKREVLVETIEPETDLHRTEDGTGADLVCLVQELPEIYRTAMELKYVFGWSDKEMAKILEISDTALRSRLSRGRNLLRKKMEESDIL